MLVNRQVTGREERIADIRHDDHLVIQHLIDVVEQTRNRHRVVIGIRSWCSLLTLRDRLLRFGFDLGLRQSADEVLKRAEPSKVAHMGMLFDSASLRTCSRRLKR